MHKTIQDALRLDLSDMEFEALALGLLREQAGSNAVYRSFLENSGFALQQASHWSEFPALPVEAFRLGAVTCFDPLEATLLFETSGTTGSATGRHYLKDGDCYKRSLEEAFRHFLPDLSGHRWISLVPAPHLKPHSSLAYMIGYLGSRIPETFPLEYVSDAHFVLDAGKLQQLLDEAAGKREQVFILGTSFALAQAAEDFAEQGKSWVLPAGSLVFDTGGYKGRRRELVPAELVALLEKTFGIMPSSVWNEYGMTELSSQGYGLLAEGLHRFPPWLKVRVIDPASRREAKEGQRGLLHFYDLANVHSVMAIATLDTGIREGDAIRLTGRLGQAPERGCSLPFEL